MIIPDTREIPYYQLDNLLAIGFNDPYLFTNIMNLIPTLDNNKYHTCKSCSSMFVTKRKNKLTCEDCGGTEILNETINETLTRNINKLLEFLEEPSGYKLDLLDLQIYLYNADMDDHFETVNGEVTKGYVIKKLYGILKILNMRRAYLRSTIRFQSQIKTPPIRVH